MKNTCSSCLFFQCHAPQLLALACLAMGVHPSFHPMARTSPFKLPGRSRQGIEHKDKRNMHPNRDLLDPLQIVELCQDHWQGHLRFQTCQRCPDAEVNAMTKGDVAIRLTPNVEAI